MSFSRNSNVLSPGELLSIFLASAILIVGVGLVLVPAIGLMLQKAYCVIEFPLLSFLDGRDIWRLALASYTALAVFLSGFSLAPSVGVGVVGPDGFSFSQPGFLGLLGLSALVFVGLTAWRSLPAKLAVTLWFLSFAGLVIDVVWLTYGGSRHGLAIELVHGIAMLAVFVQAIVTAWRVQGVLELGCFTWGNAGVSFAVGIVLVTGMAALLAYQPNERIKVFFQSRTAIHYRVLSPFQPLVRPSFDVVCNGVSPVEPAFVGEPVPQHRGVVVVLVDSLRYDAVMGSFNELEPAPGLRAFVNDSARPSRLYGIHPSTGATMRALTESPESRDLMEAMNSAGVRTVTVASHPFVARPLGHSDLVDEAPFESEPDYRFSLTSQIVTERASEHLGDLVSGDEAFLLFVHYYDPHAYYVPNDLFDFGYGLKARYAAEVAYTDHWVGSFLSKIPSNDSIATMVLSDHGDEFWDHGALDHGLRTYDESIRLVFGLQSPEIEAVEWPETRSVSAIPRTLLELLGATEHAETFEPSLFERPDHDPPVIIEARHEIAAADRFGKVILNSRTGSMEYYDFADDPKELNNLMPEALESERVRRLTCSALEASRSKP